MSDLATHGVQNSQNRISMFLDAAEKGNYNTVQALLNQTSLDAPDSLQRTPLMLAACNNHIQIVELLVQHKADINKQDFFGQTALMHATIQQHTAIVHYLLRNKAEIDIKANTHYTALCYAVIKTHIPLVKLLLKNHANSHVLIDHSGNTLLHALAQSIKRNGMEDQTIACIKLLLLCNIDPQRQNYNGQTAGAIAPQIGRLTTQIQQYRDALTQEYDFITHNAISDWILLTPREKALNQFLADRKAYADLSFKFTDSTVPVYRNETDRHDNRLAKFPQEIINRVRFFLFPRSLSQHVFIREVNYVTRSIPLTPSIT